VVACNSAVLVAAAAAVAVAVGAARGAVMRGEGCHRRQKKEKREREMKTRGEVQRVEKTEGESCEDGDGEASGVEGQQDAESTGARGSTAASPFTNSALLLYSLTK